MTLRTVDDALHVLDMLAERGEVSTREVAVELSRSRSAAYRVIRTLQDRGWMTPGSAGTYRLGPLAMAIGARAWASSSLPAFAVPWLRRLVDETEETSTLSILVGQQRVCIDQVESPRQVRMSVARGQPYALYAGASGRSILAAMDPDAFAEYLASTTLSAFTKSTVTDATVLTDKIAEDRARGYSVAYSERDPEAFSVASAIVGREGVIGSIAICGPASRFDADAARRYGELTRTASLAISAHMGWVGPQRGPGDAEIGEHQAQQGQ